MKYWFKAEQHGGPSSRAKPLGFTYAQCGAFKFGYTGCDVCTKEHDDGALYWVWSATCVHERDHIFWFEAIESDRRGVFDQVLNDRLVCLATVRQAARRGLIQVDQNAREFLVEVFACPFYALHALIECIRDIHS